MSSKLFSLVTYFIVFSLLTVVDAALYVVTPLSGSTCRGGQPCTVTWLDNGQTPLLSAIGVTHVALYTGTLKLVQTLPPVDVSSTLSFTFTPNPAAGPNSDAYYLAFTSTEAKVNGSDYRAYSPWFRFLRQPPSFRNELNSRAKLAYHQSLLDRSVHDYSRNSVN
ncbi:hypothetical protein EST38_g2649 [Candolleomyces aberdarensis]|uniref:Yeast cell wall synthesis Kre9/Knh1-like N-terminal domain-containing protein n=1 Tax=Candolleomyces aberdarensis TaxID=2316362 RepID=A0A4Q2DU38_9AGAR|nr:hypothetical protein EST38_g2649 [Candolleomyces aberdarensis]